MKIPKFDAVGMHHTMVRFSQPAPLWLDHFSKNTQVEKSIDEAQEYLVGDSLTVKFLDLGARTLRRVLCVGQ